jgi:hypothetical protein
MIKLKEKWIDDDEKIYYYIEYYGDNNQLDYYWWDDDYVTDDNLIASLDKKREQYCKDPERTTNLHIEWSKINELSK